MNALLRPLAATCALLCLLPSCSGTDPGRDQARPAPRKSLSQRVAEAPGYRQDADGNWVPGSDQRHWLDGRRQGPFANTQKSKRTFATKDLDRKTWQGGSEYNAGSYEGPTDGSRFAKNSRYGQTTSREAAERAILPENQTPGTYATDAARETSQDRPGTPSDAETDFRRRVYKAPETVDWREQRGLGINETKGLLGR